MDYLKYLNKYKTMEKDDLLDKSIIMARRIQKIGTIFEQNLDEIIYALVLAVFFCDNEIDDVEVKYVNTLIDELLLNKGVQTKKSIINTLEEDFETYKLAISKFFQCDYLDSEEVTSQYYNITGNRKFFDYVVDFMCTLIVINGDINDGQVKFLDKLIKVYNNAVSDNGNQTNVNNPSNNNIPNIPPKIIRIGATLDRESSYRSVFSVGAEISVEGSDIDILDVRIQLLDETGFILDSFDEVIYWVDKGIFYFGKEYFIDCNPKNYKIIVAPRGWTNFQARSEQIIKVTGMRFMKNDSDYDDTYYLAAMAENINFNANNIASKIYVVFYDENNKIVGGATLEGKILFLNQPDRYDTRIDCHKVISKTRTFRWSIDVYERS